jgi:hypothetical protein
VPPETVAIEFPERHYDRLVSRLVAALPAAEREEALRAVGEGFAQDLAGNAGLGRARDVRTAAERACTALGKLGFQAVVTDASEDQVTITTPTCPLRPLVLANPEAASIDRVSGSASSTPTPSQRRPHHERRDVRLPRLRRILPSRAVSSKKPR